MLNTAKRRVVVLGRSNNNDTNIQKAKKVSILELFPNPGTLKKLGNKYMSICPIHKEKNPSFCYYPSTNSWNCFSGCGGGTSIDFLMKLYNIDFKEAVERLSK